ncbi:metal-dependent transcriptional regulator [Kocuria sp.]|uniref:metal-dependent transcriptional regulator n=1 Tax=Kocuria sp. TaxID=1871328 RepID=UPI0026DEFC21|nr:metal-dependent transcriptional regulator [Kocuria sp.]MDO5366497.1 iron dependent repressor, metal binding and dimerization domain protein [Kocuria sp.]
MTDLIDTTQMYLRTVLELEEEGIPALRARIVERLGHTGPTVSETVQRLCRKGLMALSEGDIRTRTVSLTAQGREQATSVMRKHRLAERLLADVIGLELPYVHEEACRWEHVMSDRVEVLLEKLLASPTTSPYGTPIHGAFTQNPEGVSLLDAVAQTSAASGGAEADTAGADSVRPGGAGTGAGTGADAAEAGAPHSDGEREYTLELISESVQTHTELLSSLYDAGLMPGATVVISGSAPSGGDTHSSHPGPVTLRRSDRTETVEIPGELAASILVS